MRPGSILATCLALSFMVFSAPSTMAQNKFATASPKPGSGSGGAPAPGWPPHPGSIVNVEIDSSSSNATGVPSGETVFFYQVPANRMLVVTNVDIAAGDYFQVGQAKGFMVNWSLVEMNNGNVIAVKRSNRLFAGMARLTSFEVLVTGSDARRFSCSSYHSPVGLVFRPGTTVALRYDNPAPGALGSVNASLTGYLAAP